VSEDVYRFASDFQRFLAQMNELAGAGRGREFSPLRTRLDDHLGTDSTELPVLGQAFAQYDHVNLQVAMMAYLEEPGRSHDLLGLSGGFRHHGSFSDILQIIWHGSERMGAVEYVNLSIGPTDTLPCVQFGIYLITDADRHAAVLMRGMDEHGPHQGISLEVISPDQDFAGMFLEEIRRLMIRLNVFRGQVISFGASEMGHQGVGPVAFHHRPSLSRDQVILPDTAMGAIEAQVFGMAEHRERLLASGQHIKRGLLLHGPPGTGKTLTVRYLVSHLPGHTVILLTGRGLHMIRAACGLARLLEPSVVVLEDVDLIAEERGGHGPYGNPLLFDVLNEMDGMAEDADVVFLLTTNRADRLEPALAGRPGRVDLAVEIPLPDRDARLQLVKLYGRGLELRVADTDRIAERTAGVTASFIKELMRKAALRAALGTVGKGQIAVDDEALGGALDDLLSERSRLTARLLGGSGEVEGVPPRPGTEWLVELRTD